VRLLFVVLAVVGLAAPALADVSADRIDRARQTSLDSEYQQQLPRYETDHGAIDGGQDGKVNDRDAMRRSRRRANGEVHEREWVDTRTEEHQPQEMSGIASMVMWGLVIVMAVLFVVWIGSEFTKYGGDAELPASESQVAMQAAVDAIIEKPLGDADELARRGEFAEAIHTLLLRTLQELVKSSAVRVAPAMTSREILARVPLLADAREAFAGLITAVEITHFGDEPANAADYQRCREQFNVFAQALRGSSRAQAAA